MRTNFKISIFEVLLIKRLTLWPYKSFKLGLIICKHSTDRFVCIPVGNSSECDLPERLHYSQRAQLLIACVDFALEFG